MDAPPGVGFPPEVVPIFGTIGMSMLDGRG